MVVRLLLLLALLAGCAEPCEETSMVDSVGGLVVVEAEHPDAWARADCDSCHALAAVHRQSCAEEIDHEGVRGIVDAEGYESCASCHGDMGGDAGGEE